MEGKKYWVEFTSEEDIEPMKEYYALRRTDPTVVPRNHELRFIDRNGTIKHVFMTISPIPNTEKSVDSFFIMTIQSSLLPPPKTMTLKSEFEQLKVVAD